MVADHYVNGFWLVSRRPSRPGPRRISTAPWDCIRTPSRMLSRRSTTSSTRSVSRNRCRDDPVFRSPPDGTPTGRCGTSRRGPRRYPRRSTHRGPRRSPSRWTVRGRFRRCLWSDPARSWRTARRPGGDLRCESPPVVGDLQHEPVAIGPASDADHASVVGRVHRVLEQRVERRLEPFAIGADRPLGPNLHAPGPPGRWGSTDPSARPRAALPQHPTLDRKPGLPAAVRISKRSESLDRRPSSSRITSASLPI